MRPNIWKKAVKCSRGFWPALPASLIILVATVPSSASAMQADAATKAAMDKRASARTLLSTALKRIAANGNNAAALLDAGRASMALEDYRAALGFLLRAEQNAPRDGAIKAGLGTAMLHQENPRRALDYFGEAQLLKTPERLFIADRALAYDLLGQQEAAQRDYALALSQQRDDEIIRRYALSLGISGHTDRAIEYLAPMLNAQDRSAWRTRAMILAMNGRQAEAKSIVDATMPASLANNIWPYLAQMDRLTPAQLAEAAHFGRFPSGQLGPQRSAVQMAAASPQAAPAVASGNRNTRNSRSAPRPSQAAQVAQAAPPPAARASVPIAQAPRTTRSLQAEQTAKAAEAAQAAQAAQLARAGQAAQPARPVQVAAAAPVPNVRGRGPISTVRDTTASAATDAAARSRMQSTISAQSAAAQASATQALPTAATAREAPPVARAPQGPVDDSRAAAPAAVRSPDDAKPLAAMASLGDIIGNLQIPAGELARSDKAVSADTLARLREEGRRAEQAAAAERAAKARADAAAKAKADADAKAQAEAAAKAKAEEERKKANPSRMWVQIGSGSNAGALEFTFNRFAKKHSELFKSVKGGTADWGRTRRLLAGPFANRAAAQKFLTDFKAAEGDGFIFTSAVGEEVEPLK